VQRTLVVPRPQAPQRGAGTSPQVHLSDPRDVLLDLEEVAIDETVPVVAVLVFILSKRTKVFVSAAAEAKPRAAKIIATIEATNKTAVIAGVSFIVFNCIGFYLLDLIGFFVATIIDYHYATGISTIARDKYLRLKSHCGNKGHRVTIIG
jgi:hypothetical protein